MTNFKLTPTTKHYVNAYGDRCEAALLNGVWVAVWENGVVTKHFEDGREIRITRDYKPEFTITAEFTGWLSDPHENSVYPFIAMDGDGCVVETSVEPEVIGSSAKHGLWVVDGEYAFRARPDLAHQYIGDWRNSLVERKE